MLDLFNVNLSLAIKYRLVSLYICDEGFAVIFNSKSCIQATFGVIILGPRPLGRVTLLHPVLRPPNLINLDGSVR